jgi:hypothetical protein
MCVGLIPEQYLPPAVDLKNFLLLSFDNEGIISYIISIKGSLPHGPEVAEID